MNLTVEHGVRVIVLQQQSLVLFRIRCGFISDLALLLGKDSVLHFALLRRTREPQAKIDRG